MTSDQYIRLRSKGFFSYFGSISRSLNVDEEALSILEQQLSGKIDYHNLAILFPIGTGYGYNAVLGRGPLNGPDRVMIDHITYWLRVRKILTDKGVVFKNGEKMTLKKYDFLGVTMLVVKNGVAYVINNTADPLSSNLYYNKDENKHGIIAAPKDNLKPDEMNIFFSGYFIKAAESRA